MSRQPQLTVPCVCLDGAHLEGIRTFRKCCESIVLYLLPCRVTAEYSFCLQHSLSQH